MTDLWLSGVFFQAPNKLTPKLVFGGGSAPDPAGGAYDAPPHPLVGWGRGHPLPIPFPSASRLSAPSTNSWLRLWVDSHVLVVFYSNHLFTSKKRTCKIRGPD